MVRQLRTSFGVLIHPHSLQVYLQFTSMHRCMPRLSQALTKDLCLYCLSMHDRDIGGSHLIKANPARRTQKPISNSLLLTSAREDVVLRHAQYGMDSTSLAAKTDNVPCTCFCVTSQLAQQSDASLNPPPPPTSRCSKACTTSFYCDDVVHALWLRVCLSSGKIAAAPTYGVQIICQTMTSQQSAPDQACTNRGTGRGDIIKSENGVQESYRILFSVCLREDSK